MKKLFAVLLTLAMLLGLAACGSSGGGGKPSIVGTWKGSMDMSTILEMAFQMDIDKPLKVGVVFTFNEDGTYANTIDKDSVDDLMDAMVDVIIDLMAAMYGEEFDLDAMLAEEGMTKEDFTELIMASMNMNMEDMLGDMEAQTGYYKYEDGKFYTAEDKDALDKGDYKDCTYITLTGITMTVTEIEEDGEKMSELMPDMFPMVFTKQ